MKTCNIHKSFVYYIKKYYRVKSIIKKIFLILISIFLLLTQSICITYAERPHPISKTITITMHIVPNAELVLDEKKIEKNWNSLETKEISKALSQENKDLTVEKINRNGIEMLRVTKAFEEALY